MGYTKYRYSNTDIHVYEDRISNLRLLQADRLYPLSKYYLNDGDIACITNCSYFTSKYVLGRNQGDLYNNTHDQEGFYDLVILKDSTYRLGNFKSWDYQSNVYAGFSVASVLIKDGQDAELISGAIENDGKISTTNPQTALGLMKDGMAILIVVDGRTSENKGLSGFKLREFIKTKYTLDLLVQLDGGGSSEMIVDGKIVNMPSDGKERKMFNGLAFLKKEEEPKQIEIQFPCADGWISQDFHSGHMALDIGWLKKCSSNGKTPVYACADGVVEVADYYEEVVSGKKVKPIVCIIRHDNLDPNYTYYSAYWHLAMTPKNMGDVVKMGEQIGIKGNTGYSGGVHLHFVLMRCPKGTKCPTSYQFNAYAIDPKPYIFLTPEQIFDGKKTYEFPVKKKDISDKPSKPEKPETPSEDIDVLKEEIALLEAQVKALEVQISSLESEKNEYKTQMNTLNDSLNKSNVKLNAIRQYAEQIIALIK